MTNDLKKGNYGLWGFPEKWSQLFNKVRRPPINSFNIKVPKFTELIDGNESAMLLGELMLRYNVAIEAEEVVKKFIDVEKNEISIPTRLAIADVFAEKALIQITRRAQRYAIVGSAMVVVFSIFSWFSIDHLFNDYYVNSIYKNRNVLDIKWSGYSFGLEISRHFAIGAVFAACMYLSASLAKAFIQEATQLFNRRHGIRSGRLAIWLRQGDLSPAEIAMFFGVTAGENSAFSNIDPSNVSKTPVGTAADLASKLTDLAGKKFTS